MNFGVAGNSGIKKKVFAQAKAFRSHGFLVDVLYFENNTIYMVGDTANVVFEAKNKADFLFFLYSKFLQSIDIESYSYVYVRHFLTNPFFLRTLSKMKRMNDSLKIFMEIPTYPYRNEFTDMPFVKRLGLWVDERCTAYFSNCIDRIVTFSDSESIFEIPTVLSDNGIDIEQFPVLPKANFDDKNLHLLGLANVQKWHGLDRIIEGLKVYIADNKRINVIFDIGGEGSELPRLKQLVAAHGLTDNVVFHGFVSGEKLTALFKQTHVGLGSFGMHRIGVAEGQTSTLKAREYAARGLPIALGHKDRGFPADFPFLLELPANESPIDVQRIVDFYLEISKIDDYPQQINAYASQNLTWHKKLQPIVEAYRTP